MLSSRLRAGISALALLLPWSPAAAQSGTEKVVVAGQRTEADVPNKIEDVNAEDVAITVNTVRAHYALDERWSLSVGIDNLNGRTYYLYHPFPQRTFLMEVHYAQ